MRTPPMSSERTIPTESVPRLEGSLNQMPRPEFIRRWKALVGELPATMLEDRSEMIRVLVESMPIVPLAGSPPFADGDQDEQNWRVHP